jgi:hypothetical protein
MSEVDWLGAGLTILIILAIILIIVAKIQGQRIVDVLAQIRDLAKGEI